jgi:formylglycine-generating enzyme required for sulfatase activity
LISETPVPRSLFETFLNQNPEWREYHTEFFPEEISVNPEIGRDIITGITWYAAEAFCKWFTGRLPSSMFGMEVRLPTEDELEYASLNIANMQNSGWEWCADPYAPLQFIQTPYEAVQMVGSPEQSMYSRERRASLPPDFSSPFVTFRPVIANKR